MMMMIQLQQIGGLCFQGRKKSWMEKIMGANACGSLFFILLVVQRIDTARKRGVSGEDTKVHQA